MWEDWVGLEEKEEGEQLGFGVQRGHRVIHVHVFITFCQQRNTGRQIILPPPKATLFRPGAVVVQSSSPWLDLDTCELG